MSPKVSVVMPVYNVEVYVAEAVTSVLDQTFTDFELLIVDDGSTDASVDICNLIHDPRIRLIHQTNRGLAGARNTGIRKAKGDYIAFLDSDDLWTPDKLARHVAYLDANPAIGVSYSASALINAEGVPIGITQSPKTTNVTAQDVFLRNPVGNGSAPVIRRETLDAIKFNAGRGHTEFFDENFRQSEDIECWMRIALTTHWKFGGIDDCLTLYRVNEDGLSAHIDRQFKSWEAMCEKVRAVAPTFYRKWGRLSRAFQLRYLARRAARMRNRASALKLALGALVCHPAILLREPKKTLETVAAALVLKIVPTRVYVWLETNALKGEKAPAGQKFRRAHA